MGFPYRRLLFASALLAGVLFLILTFVVQQGWTDGLDLHATRLFNVRLPARLDRPGGDLAKIEAASWLQRLGDVIGILGSAEVTVLLVLVLAAWAWKDSGRYAVVLLVAFVLAQGAEVVLKLFLKHPDPRIVIGGVAAPNSYPSGHTLRIVFCAATLVLLNPRLPVLVGAVLIAVATAFGLLYLAQHWLSDVVGGALLGWTAASGAYLLAEREHQVPVTVAAGAGHE